MNNDFGDASRSLRGGNMKVLKGYKFRIYPDEQQRRFFIETFGCVRFTYNHLLIAKQGGNEETPQTPAALKKEYPFLKETDSLALANAQRNLERAFTNYFTGRAGYPKLKSKKSQWQSYTTNNQKHTIYFVGNQLKVPKLKTLVNVHRHREVKGTIKSATISAKNGKEFYVSILCSEDIEPLPKTKQEGSVCFCPHHLVGTTETLPVLDQAELSKKILKEQKKLQVRAKVAKKHKVLLKDAKNYQKQKEKVLKLKDQKQQQKKDYIDQVSWMLVRKFDALVIEEKQMTVTEDMPFSASDWQLFIEKIHYKAQWYGKQIYNATTLQ